MRRTGALILLLGSLVPRPAEAYQFFSDPRLVSFTINTCIHLPTLSGRDAALCDSLAFACETSKELDSEDQALCEQLRKSRRERGLGYLEPAPAPKGSIGVPSPRLPTGEETVTSLLKKFSSLKKDYELQPMQWADRLRGWLPGLNTATQFKDFSRLLEAVRFPANYRHRFRLGFDLFEATIPKNQLDAYQHQMELALFTHYVKLTQRRYTERDYTKPEEFLRDLRELQTALEENADMPSAAGLLAEVMRIRGEIESYLDRRAKLVENQAQLKAQIANWGKTEVQRQILAGLVADNEVSPSAWRVQEEASRNLLANPPGGSLLNYAIQTLEMRRKLDPASFQEDSFASVQALGAHIYIGSVDALATSLTGRAPERLEYLFLLRRLSGCLELDQPPSGGQPRWRNEYLDASERALALLPKALTDSLESTVSP
ncbi:MAG: hypothetical protein AB7P04_03750 [Bacteriovoracia bacterium]